MHWTGTGTAVRSVDETESGPLSVMPVRSRRPLSLASGRMSQPVESPQPLPHRLSRLPRLTVAPTPGQLVVTAALVALTSLATAVVMAQGIRHLDTSPGPDTTPYLADAPRGPVRVPPLGRVGGRGASVLGDVSNQVGPVSPDLKGPADRGVPGPLSGEGSPYGASPTSGGLLPNDPWAGTGPYDPRRPDTVVGGVIPGGNDTGTGPLIGGGSPLGGPLFGDPLHGRHRGLGQPPEMVPPHRGARHRPDTVPAYQPSAVTTSAETTSVTTSADSTSADSTTAETTTYPTADETTVDTATSETADSDATDTGTVTETGTAA